MSRLLILGAGIAGHTAALHARHRLGSKHDITVVSPNSRYNWVPSNIWVGVGLMTEEQVTLPLAPVYKKNGINFIQAKAVSIHPEGDSSMTAPYVTVEHTSDSKSGTKEKVAYDFLINSTGPKLNFDATDGLGPEKNSFSVCTAVHASQTWRALNESIQRMQKGEKQTIVVGTGHGNCTCQGAAFEYACNVEFILRKYKVRDKAEIIWISNEQELGDFGIGGLHFKQGGFITPSKVFTESLFAERGIRWITRAHVQKVDKGELFYETLSGDERSQKFNFAMLLPPFSGVGLTAFDKKKKNITEKIFAANKFMFVDADYAQKPYEEWSPEDWPKTYQNPLYENIFSVGIAFAPPHPISKPAKSPKGTPIFPTPPRTGMPSAVMARVAAYNIADIINGRSKEPVRTASLAKMGAACIASAGANPLSGTAASMTIYPIVPDFKKYPGTGRSLRYTTGEIGLAGHWIKHLLHFGFIYKAKAKPFWRLIPE